MKINTTKRPVLGFFATVELTEACQTNVPHAIPDMLEVRDCHYKMGQIRLAYIQGIPQAISDMLKVKECHKKWQKLG